EERQREGTRGHIGRELGLGKPLNEPMAKHLLEQRGQVARGTITQEPAEAVLQESAAGQAETGGGFVCCCADQAQNEVSKEEPDRNVENISEGHLCLHREG